MADDPFPRDRIAATVRRLPAYLRLAWRLARDPLLSRARRAAVIAAAGYLASPVDLVPGIIPVVGQLDDIAVALGALKLALAGLDPSRRRSHLEAVGLDDQSLTDDLRTVGATTAWLARAGLRTTGRAVRAGGRAAATGARAAATRVVPAVRDAAARVAPAAKDAARKAGPVARDVAATGLGAVRRVAIRARTRTPPP